MTIVVFVEHIDGKIKKSSREAVCYGAAMGGLLNLSIYVLNKYDNGHFNAFRLKHFGFRFQ